MKAVKSEEQRSVRNSQRRKFIQKAGTVGVGAPATALLLSVTRKKARADSSGYGSYNEKSSYNENSSQERPGETPFFSSQSNSASQSNQEYYMHSERGMRYKVFGNPDAGGKGGPGE